MTCPLCASEGHRVIGTLDLAASISAMTVDLPLSEVMETPVGSTVQLRSCTACDLAYFSPAAVGSARLYEHLAEGDYYEPLRWDQQVALELVRPGMRIVDLGCGSGSFVLEAAKRGADAVGVDFSAASSVNASNARFIAARADLAEGEVDRVRRATGQRDLVAAFQLVEHLADPVTFVRNAGTLLADDGCIVVSVPNRHRFAIDPVQALDCPPHHQTRWTTSQLDLLGRRAGLVVEEIHVERVTNPLRVAHRLLRRAGRRRPGGWPLPPAAPPWPPSHWFNGMSLVATYRLPD